jgi:hypothetical protein
MNALNARSGGESLGSIMLSVWNESLKKLMNSL